jgi:hypothetical protein
MDGNVAQVVFKCFVFDRGVNLLGGQRVVQPDGNACAGFGGEYVPAFGLASRLPEGLRFDVIRVDLDGELLAS